MEMCKKDMLIKMIEHYDGGNKARFAKRLCISPQTISAWISRSTYDAELIYAKCIGISAGWLLSGAGSMLAGGSPSDADAKQAIYDLTIENLRLKRRIDELEEKGGAENRAV